MKPPEPAATLADLPVGSAARVLAVRGAGPAGDRLRELGLLAGTTVRCLRRAPLGDPLLFDLRGYQLALRREEAHQVEVEPL